MNKIPYIGIFLIIFVFFHFINPPEAKAYLDPGTGSYILQIIIAGVFASLFFLKTQWNHLKCFFKNLFSRKKDEQSKK